MTKPQSAYVPTMAPLPVPSVPLKINLQVTGSMDDTTLLKRLVLAEGAGEGLPGMAAIARSILNRQAAIASGKVSPGAYGAKSGSLRDVVYAPGQYTPIRNGSINRNWSASQMAEAAKAIAIAQDGTKFDRLMLGAGLNPDQVDDIRDATGFRNLRSQNPIRPSV